MSNLIENRHIRFFISSTFQDMHDERDYLMKHVFPELRIIAAKRNVTLTELDLRWGVTEEESRLGKVLGICLNEIENSIPFFIGIVGLSLLFSIMKVYDSVIGLGGIFELLWHFKLPFIVILFVTIFGLVVSIKEFFNERYDYKNNNKNNIIHINRSFKNFK